MCFGLNVKKQFNLIYNIFEQFATKHNPLEKRIARETNTVSKFYFGCVLNVDTAETDCVPLTESIAVILK